MTIELEQRENGDPCSQVGFQNLPKSVLTSIFQCLGKDDLLNLCRVSKHCYSVASQILYKNIIIMNYVDYSDYRAEDPFWPFYCCTVMEAGELESLVDTLKDNKLLAGLVESVIVANTNQVYLLPELLSYTQLKYFHCQEIVQPPRKSFDRTERLSCCVSSACIAKPDVTELKLIQPSSGVGLEHYQNVS